MGLRYLTAGESHGVCLVAILEGFPAGVRVAAGFINTELERRQAGYGRGPRMRIERDRVEILSGVRHGLSLGSPIALEIRNRDWANWRKVMGVELSGGDVAEILTRPRPGHADLAGALKYGFRDIRDVLERASARETAVRVTVGALAKALLGEFGITVSSHVTSIGKVSARPNRSTPAELRNATARSKLNCADPRAEKAMIAEIDRARRTGDSLGGVFEVIADGVPAGLGSYVQWDRRLDGRFARALMSIQAVKGVDIGLGFGAARLPGSRVHDEIFWKPEESGSRLAGGFCRSTNRAGGLEGGVTNGEPIILRAAMKPIATLRKPLASVDVVTKQPVEASRQRADVCAVPAASVVGEAAVAFELAQALLEKLGGDSLVEMRDRYERMLSQLGGQWGGGDGLCPR